MTRIVTTRDSIENTKQGVRHMFKDESLRNMLLKYKNSECPVCKKRIKEILSYVLAKNENCQQDV